MGRVCRWPVAMTKCRAMLPRPFRLIPLLILLAAATPTLAQRTRVNVTVDRSPASTRLVLTHSEQIGYVIQEGNGRLEVIYSRPVVIEPAAQRFDDDVLYIGNHPRFAHLHAEFVQRLGNMLEVYVLGAAREDLVADDQHTRGDGTIAHDISLKRVSA